MTMGQALTVFSFQHTAARRRLAAMVMSSVRARLSFNTQPPEGGWRFYAFGDGGYCGFNTQPPEGGWLGASVGIGAAQGFNTQPPEGGWSLSQKPCSIRFRSPDFAKLPRKARTRV